MGRLKECSRGPGGTACRLQRQDLVAHPAAQVGAACIRGLGECLEWTASYQEKYFCEQSLAVKGPQARPV